MEVIEFYDLPPDTEIVSSYEERWLILPGKCVRCPSGFIRKTPKNAGWSIYQESLDNGSFTIIYPKDNEVPDIEWI